MQDRHDIYVLVLISLLPVIAGYAAFSFFFRHRQHKQRLRWSSLLVGNVLVLVLACAFVILLGELYYRFVYDTTDSFGLTKTTTRWFERHFQYNTIGFRDSLNYEPIRKGPRRVTFLGDSFTVGHGVADVEQRFGNRVRAARPDLEVHVVAQAGWDTGEELWNVHALVDSGYELDVVVLAYCLNDLADLVPEWQQILDRIYETSKPSYLVQHSYLLNTWYYRWRATQDPDVANYYQFVRSNYEGSVWQLQQERLVSLQQAVEGAGGKLLVVTFPFLHELGAEYRYQEVHEQLAQFWKERGVVHLDLLDVLASYSPAAATVNRYDAHPNEEAHRVVAQAIVELLDLEVIGPND